MNGISDLFVERDNLSRNLAAGTCVGKPASRAQQEMRRRRIRAIDRLLAA